MPRRSKPTFPIPQEVIDAAANIKGSAQRVILADEIKRCLEEDDQDGAEAVAAIRDCRSFAEALAVAQEYVIFEIAEGERSTARKPPVSRHRAAAGSLRRGGIGASIAVFRGGADRGGGMLAPATNAGRSVVARPPLAQRRQPPRRAVARVSRPPLFGSPRAPDQDASRAGRCSPPPRAARAAATPMRYDSAT